MKFRIVAIALALGTSAFAQIAPLSPETRAAMTGKSWRPGCPVALDDLASVTVKYLGFDQLTHEGTLVVHKSFAVEVARIFGDLYNARFPIHKIAPWEDYGPNKYAEQDITVAFYCEKADDAPNEWSSHAYGIAIDLNPLENPFRNPGKPWWPKGSEAFATRDGGRGKVSQDGAAFAIFSRYGWDWGGLYTGGETEYMHFNKKVDRKALESK
jgi:poly-gamma-glutamate synthesis protein (capsule biosynthesis protein)